MKFFPSSPTCIIKKIFITVHMKIICLFDKEKYDYMRKYTIEMLEYRLVDKKLP